ncbi:MAG TPA: LLM class flavin-dependent oxidoreductase [Candidatus Dormibacteraeota bacterium]|nr:LLM class flavin-dependent oxidoreductase [Candidatus Dormibacteraeota bacterium]
MDYGRPVRFGIFLTPIATPHVLDAAVLADQLGFDVIGVQDHPYQRRFFDTITLLTAIAVRTQRVTVFPDVANMQLRPPALLAKAAATIDILSGGRFELGLGAGGFSPAVHAYGGPQWTPGEAVSALEEAIHVVRRLWSGEHGIKFEGRYHHLSGAHSGPIPVHPIGIWLGAYKPRMLSLVGRLADGWVPSLGYLTPDDLSEGNKRIDEAAAAAGRDPRKIRRILNAGELPRELLVELVLEHGMDTFLVTEDPAAMRQFADEVAPRVREEVESERSHRAD